MTTDRYERFRPENFDWTKPIAYIVTMPGKMTSDMQRHMMAEHKRLYDAYIAELTAKNR